MYKQGIIIFIALFVILSNGYDVKVRNCTDCVESDILPVKVDMQDCKEEPCNLRFSEQNVKITFKARSSNITELNIMEKGKLWASCMDGPLNTKEANNYILYAANMTAAIFPLSLGETYIYNNTIAKQKTFWFPLHVESIFALQDQNGVSQFCYQIETIA